MDLMPHIDSYLKNLATITESIVVKRPDKVTENNNEENIDNIETYFTYKDIIDGVDTYTSYSKVPTSVLSKLVKWNNTTSNFGSKERPGTGYVVKCVKCSKLDSGAKLVIKDSQEASDDEINISHVDIYVEVGDYVVFTSPKTITYFDFRAPTETDQLEPGTVFIHKLGVDVYPKIYKQELTSDDKYDYVFKIGSVKYNNEIPDGQYYDKDTKNICRPYIDVIYADASIDLRQKYDDYGNPYILLSDKKYKYDTVMQCYYISNVETGKLYQKYYVSGFYYEPDQYIIDETSTTYVTNDEYRENIYRYVCDGYDYVYVDGEYIIDEDDEYADYVKYKKVNDAIKHSSNAYCDGLKCSFNAPTQKITSYKYEYYFMPDVSGDFAIKDGTYVEATETSTSFRYTKIKTDDKLDRYVLAGDKYIRMPSGNYTYYCSDVSCWVSSSIPNATNATNFGQIPAQYRNSIISLLREYYIEKYCPKVNSKLYRVPLYEGEENPYYRTLNGLPKDDEQLITSPRIDRLTIDPGYIGTDRNPYVYKLTDGEIEIITNNGTLDKLKKLQPAHEYLNYLGKNRIDVIVAREAQPFDIIRMGDVENATHIKLFKLAYNKSKKYVLGRYYQPEIFQGFDKYISYIGFLIISHTICQCISESDGLLIYDQYTDDETMNLILESYGFKGVFKDFPTIYKKMIAKNILALIKYRGTDYIYKLIYNICGVTEFNVYKYDILNSNNTISVIKKSVLDGAEESGISISELTKNDDLWKAGEDTIKSLKFIKSSTKYIDLETYFDLSQLTLNNSYLLNYLLDVSKGSTVTITNDLGQYKLFDMIVALFAAQSIIFGFTGTIPNTVSSAATVYKFNIAQAANGDNEVKNILETYKSKVSGESKSNILHLIDMISKKKSVILPDSNSSTVRSFADAYFASMRQDSPNTNLNENSFYREVVKYKSLARNIEEYKCYVELLNCIATSGMLAENFTMNNPIWEPIFLGTYTGSLANYDYNNYTSKIWGYDDDVWRKYNNIINTSYFKAGKTTVTDIATNVKLFSGIIAPELVDTLTDSEGNKLVGSANENYYLKISTTSANTYLVTLYRKCFTAMTYSMYLQEHCPSLYNKLYTLELSNSYVLNVYENILNVDLTNVSISNINNITNINFGNTGYELKDENGNEKIDKIIINTEVGEVITYSDYTSLLRNNAYSVYKKIMTTIENSLCNDVILDNLAYSMGSTESIKNYIDILINIFKSYNTDIRDNKIIYTIGESKDRKIKLFDIIETNDNQQMKDGITIKDTIDITVNKGE